MEKVYVQKGGSSLKKKSNQKIKINGKDFLFLIKGGWLFLKNNIPALIKSVAINKTKTITIADEMKGGWNSPEKMAGFDQNPETDDQCS